MLFSYLRQTLPWSEPGAFFAMSGSAVSQCRFDKRGISCEESKLDITLLRRAGRRDCLRNR